MLLVGAPAGLDIGPLPAQVVVDAEQAPTEAPTEAVVEAPTEAVVEERARCDDVTGYDVALFFTASQRELAARFQALTARLTSAGSLWVCWPKRASGVNTDVTENAVRAAALPRGWVDNKVCAIDATWSGLRLVLRVENRPKRPQADRHLWSADPACRVPPS
ncbi:MAG: DUF3052 domain-containing protein [Frankiaceae bacterium]